MDAQPTTSCTQNRRLIESRYRSYELRPGDGVTLTSNGAIHGRIAEIIGCLATVHWFFGRSGCKSIELKKLEYMPTEDQIQADCTAIQREWSDDEEQKRCGRYRRWPADCSRPHSLSAHVCNGQTVFEKSLTSAGSITKVCEA